MEKVNIVVSDNFPDIQTIFIVMSVAEKELGGKPNRVFNASSLS